MGQISPTPPLQTPSVRMILGMRSHQGAFSIALKHIQDWSNAVLWFPFHVFSRGYFGTLTPYKWVLQHVSSFSSVCIEMPFSGSLSLTWFQLQAIWNEPTASMGFLSCGCEKGYTPELVFSEGKHDAWVRVPKPFGDPKEIVSWWVPAALTLQGDGVQSPAACLMGTIYDSLKVGCWIFQENGPPIWIYYLAVWRSESVKPILLHFCVL